MRIICAGCNEALELQIEQHGWDITLKVKPCQCNCEEILADRCIDCDACEGREEEVAQLKADLNYSRMAHESLRKRIKGALIL